MEQQAVNADKFRLRHCRRNILRELRRCRRRDEFVADRGHVHEELVLSVTARRSLFILDGLRAIGIDRPIGVEPVEPSRC